MDLEDVLTELRKIKREDTPPLVGIRVSQKTINGVALNFTRYETYTEEPSRLYGLRVEIDDDLPFGKHEPVYYEGEPS